MTIVGTEESSEPTDLSIASSKSSSVAGSPVFFRPELNGDATVQSHTWSVKDSPASVAPGQFETTEDGVGTLHPENPGDYTVELTTTLASGEQLTATKSITVESRPDLIDKYAPVIEFDDEESYFPTRYQAYFRNSELSTSGESIEGPTAWNLADAASEATLSLMGEESQYKTYDDTYPPTVHASVHPDVTYEGEQYTAVTYWLFYVHDPKGNDGLQSEFEIGPHNSDTETVTVLLQDGEPQSLTASQHYGGEHREWSKVDTRGNRPLVYPAQGAHANYLRNTSAYDGDGFVIQNQFWPGPIDVPREAYTETTGGGPVWSPTGQQGTDYQIVPLTGNELWQSYRGLLTDSQGTVPKLRDRWNQPGDWVAGIPSDESQIDGEITSLAIQPDGSVRVDIENNGPKPHRFSVAVEAKPASDTWNSDSVRSSSHRVPVGTATSETTDLSVLPDTVTKEWDVRAVLRSYPLSIAEAEDELDTQSITTDKPIQWSARQTDGNQIRVTAEISNTMGDVDSVTAIWDTGLSDIFGSRAEMGQSGDREYSKVIPPGGSFQTGEDIQVKVRATNSSGSHTTEIRDLTVEDTAPKPPAADFTTSPSTVMSGQEITLDASDSIDPDNDIRSYKWDIDGDGTVDERGEVVTHTYTDSGSYDVSLTVSDSNSETVDDTITKTVSVTDQNTPPTADAGGPYETIAGNTVALDSSSSSDSDGRIASKSWNVIDGPGSASDGTYSAPANVDSEITATVELNVTDDNGDSDTSTATVTVTPDTRSASFGVSITDTTDPVESGSPMTVNAVVTNTGDAAGTQTVELLDFDGNVVDTRTVTLDPGSQQSISLAWQTESDASGSGDVTVETDNDTAAVSVTVAPNSGTATLTGSDTTTQDQRTTPVSFALTNTGETEAGFILDVSLPDDWNIRSQRDAGGTWNSEETKWLWQTIAPGETVEPTLTVAVPDTQTGTYEIPAQALTKNSVVAETNATVEVTDGLPVPRAIDANGNSDGQIGDIEVLTAIDHWRSNSPVANAARETISDFQILEIIDMWRSNEAVGQ